MAAEPYQPPTYDIEVPQSIRLEGGQVLPLPTESEPLTIEEAVAIGLSLHEDVAEAQALVDQAMARIRQNRAPALPSINVAASYLQPLYYNIAQDGSGLAALSAIPGLGGLGGGFAAFAQAPQGTQESLQIRQMLFDFNRTRSSVKAAEARTKAAQAGLEATKQQLAFEIRNAFLELLKAERLTEVQLLTAENQAIHIDEARKLFEVGIGLPVDVVRAQTQYANLVGEFTQQRNQTLLNRVRLATLLGVDPRTPFVIKPPLVQVDTNPDLQALVERALTQKPTLAQTSAELEAQKFQLENAQASNNPRITTTLNFQGNQVTPQPQTESLSLMLNLELPLYDGGLAKAQADEARAGIELNRARLSRLERQIVEEVSSAYIELRTAVQLLETSEVAVLGAEESVRVATGRYKLGLGDFLEVLDAEQALATARTNRVNALTQLEQAEASLKFAVGD